MRERRWAGKRDFVLVWSGETLSELGSQVSTVAFPLLVLAETGSAAKAGVIGLAKWLPLALFAIPAGVIADRVNRKRLMIGCDAVRCLALVSVVVALAVGRPPFAQLIVVALLDGGLFVVSYITERSSLPQLVPPDELPDAVALNEGRWFGANVVGPPLGGLLYAVGRGIPFLVDAVSYLASTLALALTRVPFQEARERLSYGGRSELTAGMAWLLRMPFFRVASALFCAGNPLFTGLYLLAILLAKHHGASSAEVGAMFAIVGGGGLFGAFLTTRLRRRLSARTSVVLQDWLMAAVIPLLLVAHNALLIGLIIAVTELLTPTTNSVIAGHRVRLTPDELRGRVQAASTTLSMALAWVGPLLAGILFQEIGPVATVLAAAGYALLLAVVATTAGALREAPWLSARTASESA